MLITVNTVRKKGICKQSFLTQFQQLFRKELIFLIADLIVTYHLKTAHQILRIVHCYNVSMSIIFDHPLFFYENNLWFLFRARIVTAIYK